MGMDCWCFCNGGGKSERLKAAIFTTKSPAIAKLSSGAGAGGGAVVSGTGFLIHRNLFLTTHHNLPSVNVADSTEIHLQNGVPATLVPHRFFITSSVLDLTIVGLDITEGDSVSPVGHQPQYLKLCSKPNLELGNTVYPLGHAEKKELSIGEGKVVIATDNLIKFSTEGFTWKSGSAGFDSLGNLAFMICDPMKIAKSSSPSKAWKKDHNLPTQFGIPLPVIFDWLNQHWEGSLDDLSKPKLPLMRLVSSGRRSEHSCASFSMRRVFKEENEGPASSSNTVFKKEIMQFALLDINFPPRTLKLPQTHFSTDPIPLKDGKTGYNEECGSMGSPSLYSAETAESRNCRSPREGRFQPVGRSQSCVSSNYRNRNAHKSAILEKQISLMKPRNNYSQGTPSHKTIDYFSPTVSSIMKKKRNDMEQRTRMRPTAVVHSSGRWNF